MRLLLHRPPHGPADFGPESEQVSNLRDIHIYIYIHRERERERER